MIAASMPRHGGGAFLTSKSFSLGRPSSTSGTGPNLFGLGGANLRQGRAVNLAQANDRQLQRGGVSDTSTQVHEAT